jgi:hypothetical protein
MSITLVGEKGHLSTIYKRTPRHIPRLGETVYLGSGLESKVNKVTYQGHDLNTIVIELEPIPTLYREQLMSKLSRLALKRHSDWMYYDGRGYDERPLILD